MIIAAHAGTGKTVFAQKVFDAVDFVCMPFKYYLPDGILSYEESESKKADLNLKMQNEWPENYIKAVINQYNEHRYVIIPPIIPVLDSLRREEIPYILCYPEDSGKDEYEKRYRERGNSEDFLDVFIGGWDHFLSKIKNDTGKYHMVMKDNEYLTDLCPRIDEIIKKEETQISFDLDEESLEYANELYIKTGYTIQTLMRRELIKFARSGELPDYLKNNNSIGDYDR